MGAYFLQSGKFAGRAIETMMFDWSGYRHLDRIFYNANKKGDQGQFATRLRDLFARAEHPRIAVQCQCGKTAKYIAARIRHEGVAFFGYHCDDCKEEIYLEATAVKLIFSSVDGLHFATDKKMFIAEMRKACGFSGRITAEEAYAVFYPPAPAPVQPVPRVISSPAKLISSQLPLF